MSVFMIIPQTWSAQGKAMHVFNDNKYVCFQYRGQVQIALSLPLDMALCQFVYVFVRFLIFLLPKQNSLP